MAPELSAGPPAICRGETAMMSNYPQYTDRDAPAKVRDGDGVLSWVAAITVLIVIMAIIIGHRGYIDAANNNPRSVLFTTGTSSPPP
jgi:hypothetical protein